MRRARRVCVVAPELPGSEIGTHCLGLAEAWAREEGREATLLYSGSAEPSEVSRCRSLLADKGVRYADLSGFPPQSYPQYSGTRHTALSQRIFRFLRAERFDIVCFQDRLANGFIPIQAKRTGLALCDTSLLVFLNGPSEWLFEITKRSSFDPYEQTALGFAERYCAEHADEVIDSGRGAREWALGKGWKLAVPRLPASAGERPPVSICVAHHNHGKYLPQLLKSLAQLDYPRFEVIVADDGSTEAASLESFQSQRGIYESRGWRFLRKANEGVGATRNFAAREARGEFLIFMDADNVALPHMASAFVRGMRTSGVDCLASHYDAFQGESPPAGPFTPLYGHIFMGPCVELGLLEDVFGDANFCVRKDAFWKAGGFGTERHTGWEDWEFLASLALQGYSQDVIPEPLYLYRYSERGWSRSTPNFDNRRRVLRPYARSRDFDWGRVCERLLVPYYGAYRSAISDGPRPIFHPDLSALVEWVRWLDERPRLNKPVTIPLKYARKLYRGAKRAAAYISPSRFSRLSSSAKSARS